MENEKTISNAILVKDDSVKDIRESELLAFLKKQGFSLWKIKDDPACNWIYISLNDKTYMPGIPRVPITSALGNHAVTVDEFNIIYTMFEKYSALEPLCMTEEEVVIRKMREKVAVVEKNRYFKDLSYEEYLSRCKQFIREIVGKKEPEKYIDAFIKEEEEMFQRDYDKQIYPNTRGYEISLMYERYDVEAQNDVTTKTPEEILSAGIFGSIDLRSQNMDVCLQVFEESVQENEMTLFRYRFIAEDEVSVQCIDIDLEDTVGAFGVAQLFLALDDKMYEKDRQEVYSWGCVEFMPWRQGCERRLTIFVYPGDVPDENDTMTMCNQFTIEFGEEEIENFKSFLFDIYQKMCEAEE